MERRVEIDGVSVQWRQEGDAPILYLHGVPTASWDWQPFLERTGGIAPDLPGFGGSGKPNDFDYSIAGYDRFVERFAETVGLDRFSLVMHDWGVVGLAFAQRFPERIERIVVLNGVPLLPGYRWHRIARIWRTPLVGELAMGFTMKSIWRRTLPAQIADRSWEDFDHGTQRAIIKLYRGSPEPVLAEAGARLDRVRVPTLVIAPTADPYIPAEFGRLYADALAGTVELVEGGGHWPWLDRPEIVDRVASFLAR